MELVSASRRKARSSAERPFTAGCTASRILSNASIRRSRARHRCLLLGSLPLRLTAALVGQRSLARVAICEIARTARRRSAAVSVVCERRTRPDMVCLMPPSDQKYPAHGPTVIALGVLVCTLAIGSWPLPGAAAIAGSHTLRSAVIRHLESGSAGPDAVTAFGSASSAVAGVSLPGLNAPIVGIAATPDGRGYWLVAADGGVFTFGDAAFARVLGQPDAQRADRRDRRHARRARATGWWPPTAGCSPSAMPPSHGSLGNLTLNAPIVGIAATPDGRGLLAGGRRRRGVHLRRCRLRTGPWATSRSMRRSSGSPPRPTGAATGWWPPTAGCSPSAMPPSHGSLGNLHAQCPDRRYRRHARRARATGWWPPTAGCSPSATPPSQGPMR